MEKQINLNNLKIGQIWDWNEGFLIINEISNNEIFFTTYCLIKGKMIKEDMNCQSEYFLEQINDESFEFKLRNLYKINKKDFNNIEKDYKNKWMAFNGELEEYKGKWTCFESCITHKPSTTLLIEGLHFQIVD